ncbi:hypothetical protein ES702_03469 [subsurface metagenome]
MQEQPDFLKEAVIKDHIKTVEKMRSSEDAIDELSTKNTSLILAIIKEAATLAKEANRKTIMLEDIAQAYETCVGKEHLTWEEVLKQILQQSPADLGKISKGINDYIEKE